MGFALLVGQYRQLMPIDAIPKRQPEEHDATANTIERSPPEATHRFDHRVLDFADDLGWP